MYPFDQTVTRPAPPAPSLDELPPSRFPYTVDRPPLLDHLMTETTRASLGREPAQVEWFPHEAYTVVMREFVRRGMSDLVISYDQVKGDLCDSAPRPHPFTDLVTSLMETSKERRHGLVRLVTFAGERDGLPVELVVAMALGQIIGIYSAEWYD